MIAGSDRGKGHKEARKVTVTRGNGNFKFGTRSDVPCRFLRAGEAVSVTGACGFWGADPASVRLH